MHRKHRRMKLFTKQIGLKLTVVILMCCLVTIVSCKKRKAFKQEDGQVLVDISTIRANTDLVMAEANDVISGQFFLRGKPSGVGQELASVGFSTCAMLVDTSTIYAGKLTFNYTGNACDNLKREGQVIVSIVNYPLKKWTDKGTVIKLEFVNYSSTDVTENKSIKINGVEYITNESGGTWYELRYLNQANVVNSISGDALKVIFDKTTSFTYSVARRITYTIKGSVISASSVGIASQNNNSNVDCWGVTREDMDYSNQIETAILWNTTCTSIKPLSGEAIVKVNGKYFDLKALYGIDADGNASTANCAYGYKVSWSYKNSSRQRIFNY